MSNEFYDPLLEAAGSIAEEYAISISDVMGLLQLARRDEARVRGALTASMDTDIAREASRTGRAFDLVEQARILLRGPEGHQQQIS